jgi:hypothetical protein
MSRLDTFVKFDVSSVGLFQLMTAGMLENNAWSFLYWFCIHRKNSTLPYLGKDYPFKVLSKQEKNSIRFIDGEFIITLSISKPKSPTASNIERLYEHWLTKTARLIFMDKVKSYSERLGIPKPGKISIKKLKNRWGSMGKNGRTVNLNVNLLKASEDIIDYIVLHELCHLKIKELPRMSLKLLKEDPIEYDDVVTNQFWS